MPTIRIGLETRIMPIRCGAVCAGSKHTSYRRNNRNIAERFAAAIVRGYPDVCSLTAGESFALRCSVEVKAKHKFISALITIRAETLVIRERLNERCCHQP